MSLSPRKQIVMDVFNMFDTDGSGEIELDEIAKAFKTTGKLTDETRAQLKAHFDFMDSDGSGKLFDTILPCLFYCIRPASREPPHTTPNNHLWIVTRLRNVAAPYTAVVRRIHENAEQDMFRTFAEWPQQMNARRGDDR